ncbi:unnamed protein product [Eruca vesicaria subsp. sativa]|uniref:Uncharacterized protein n=1 Tax=Eruca vesicaria subsp. sativa TaxID=29727 RepID=A0ABC8M1L4_ERUVS|nr:unnamed protein product [Eruca vesicaria subsp. sativa]
MPVLKAPLELGNGRIHVLELSPGVTESTAFDTADAVYDVCWSEQAREVPQNTIGSLQVPSPRRRDNFLTALWDDTVKLWAMDRPARGFGTLRMEEFDCFLHL